MMQKIAMAACGVLWAMTMGVAAQADATRTVDARAILANVAPPEADEPQPAPATPPADAGFANSPTEATPTDAAPAEVAPAEATPAATDAQTATPEATASDAASGDQPASGMPPWTWIAVGVAILAALGFGLWWRNARG